MAGEIRRSATACKELLDTCAENPILKQTVWIKTAQGSFNLWCSGIKATNVGKSSLDYRLRNRSDVRESICDLLGGLLESLEKCLHLATSESSCS